jgi:sulfoxide reductase heme-binding subunit YedZ
MWSGWLAVGILLLLAATSNDASVRWLKRRWQLLHRAAYIAAILSFAHWVLSAFDPVPGYLHFAVLAILETIRLIKTPRRAAVPSGKR